VCLLTADNLACHSLCGYVESFSVNRFCQFCLIDKPISQYIFDEDNTERHTRENYAHHVTSKHHFMTHYPSVMTLFGPISKLWSMRFEAKHNPHAQVVCNFRNISKTLAHKHQIQQMYHWKLSSPLNFEMTVPNAFPVTLTKKKYISSSFYVVYFSNVQVYF